MPPLYWRHLLPLLPAPGWWLGSVMAVGWFMVPPAHAQLGTLDESIFFREGREQFETEIERLQADSPPPVLTINDGVQQWQPVVSEAGGFSVWAPLGIFSDETEDLNLAGTEVTFRLLASQVQTGRYLVAYAPVPADLSSEAALAALATAVTERVQVPLVSDRSLPEADYSPRELLFQASDRTIILHLLSGADHLYVVGVEQTDGGDVSASSIAFLESFQLLMP